MTEPPSLEARLARARRDQREHTWVTRRIAGAREDRERVEAELAVARQALAYEHADVERLTHGLGGMFRRLFADREDLSREQQELAAAQLRCDELDEELRAIDVDLAQLAARAATVADADARYADVLADAEWLARARGELHAELDALAATEAELAAHRSAVAEAIGVGVAVQRAFTTVVNRVRDLVPRQDHDPEPILGEGLLAAITGKTASIYSELSSALAYAQHGVRSFAHACQALTALPSGVFETQFPALPSVDRFVLRDVLWSARGVLDSILPEVSRISSAVSAGVGELRHRDTSLGAAVAECARMRARLLDPGTA